MKLVETVLLVTAYSTILITIFVGIICYRRNIEKLETIAFSISLLLLIIAITISEIFGDNTPTEPTNIFILLSMILVGLTTPLSVMTERKHNLSSKFKYLLFIVSGTLFVVTVLSYFIDKIKYLDYTIAAFLGVSVVFSMLLIIRTKPNDSYSHLEKTNRIFSIAFMVLVPISLVLNYVFSNSEYNLKIGLILPLVFILLAANKLFDDLQRLSLINRGIEPIEQHFKNYGLSKREIEVATLLAKGKTYSQISEELHISLPTVKTHSSNIYKKCKVNNRHELTILLTS